MHRCAEKEKQVGLSHTSNNNSSAHHPHHHRNIACCCHSNDQCQWLQNHSHLCCWHHSEKSKAMTSAMDFDLGFQAELIEGIVLGNEGGDHSSSLSTK